MCISVRDRTIGNKKTEFAKDCSPSCVPLVQIRSQSNVQLVLFAVALIWFNYCCDCSILCLSVWMFLLYKKIKLPWFFRCFCSTVSESHRITTATAVPCLTTPCICAFGGSLTLLRTRCGSLLWLMSPDFGSTKGILCCKTILRHNKYVCTDKLPMILSLISCCGFYNSNCV